MNQRYRVLFVPGSGERGRETNGTWKSSDVGVGLQDALPSQVFASLDVESSTHGRLLPDAQTVATPTAPLGEFLWAPGTAIKCSCCRAGPLYNIYAALLDDLHPVARISAEWLMVALMHPDVVRFTGDSELRETVCQRVREDLDRVNPDIVIAHSLGSAVAIEALAVSERSPKLLITAGGPLAWPRFTQTWSSDARRWLADRSCAWTNLIDLSDEVTGCRIPPRDLYGNVQNVVVDNDHYSKWFRPDGGLSSTHSLRHYLRHAAVKDAFLRVCD